MILYSKVQGGSLALTYDPDNKELYTLVYRPEVWSSSIEVIQDSLILAPTVPNGCMYQVSQGGVTGTTEPVWNTSKDSITKDGATVKFKCIPYKLLLKTGDIIQSFTILPVAGLVTDSSLLVSGSIIRFRVTTFPLTAFSLTLRITVLLASGIVTQYDDTILFTPKNL
jgi:hypothetical protein